MRASFMPQTAAGGTYMPQAVITSTDSLRTQIMAALVTRLATITTANGYRTEAGSNAYEWRDHAFSTTMLPGIEYRDTGEDQEFEAAAAVYRTLHVELTALASTGAAVRDIIADIEEAIGTDISWGGLADTTRLPSSAIETQQLGTQLFGAGIVFDIEYTTGRWSPDS